MSRQYCQHNQYRCCNHRDTCFDRSYIQLAQGSGTGILLMDKSCRIRSDIQRDNVGTRYLQVPASCCFRMRINSYCFCRCSGLFDNT